MQTVQTVNPRDSGVNKKLNIICVADVPQKTVPSGNQTWLAGKYPVNL